MDTFGAAEAVEVELLDWQRRIVEIERGEECFHLRGVAALVIAAGVAERLALAPGQVLELGEERVLEGGLDRLTTPCGSRCRRQPPPSPAGPSPSLRECPSAFAALECGLFTDGCYVSALSCRSRPSLPDGRPPPVPGATSGMTGRATRARPVTLGIVLR